MGPAELIILAVALAMDAFAVSICLGLGMKRATVKSALTVGLYFGIFQTLMPFIGYFAAALFADAIEIYDHWIVFFILLILGIRMIAGSFGDGSREYANASLSPAKMLPYALATSIDALAVGISLAFIKEDIATAAAAIGIITFALSMVGVRLGSVLGMRSRSKAELAGGVVLILIGVKIVMEHCGII